jgi:hypothetical protein
MVDYENPYQDKIDKDKKKLVELKAGTANQQLINAAYLGARKEPPAVMTWMNAAESGLTSFTEAIDESKKARQVKLDEMNGKIDEQIDNLTTTGFSLGKTYYSAANEYTKGLREEYLAAEGNPERQNEIKMELNVASQNIGGTKTAIEEIATAWGVNEDESTLERSGLSEDQINIIKTVTNDANAVWDYDENTFVWKDPISGETYTTKHIQDIQKIASRDYVGKEKYIKDEQLQVENGMLFREDGTGEAFNPRKQTLANEKRVTKENINFYINGDFTNDGTPSFKDEFQNHPDFNLDKPDNVIFKALEASGKYPDRPGSPAGFDLTDMPDPTPDDNEYTAQDLIALAENVYKAVTDENAVGYNFDVTKGLVAEYMTLRQQEKFYGGKVSDIELINPEDYDNEKDYIDAGGNIGYANKVMGYSWGEKLKRGKSYSPPRFEWKIDASKGYKAKFGGGKY